mgnify:CR=1 FL=1
MVAWNCQYTNDAGSIGAGTRRWRRSRTLRRGIRPCVYDASVPPDSEEKAALTGGSGSLCRVYYYGRRFFQPDTGRWVSRDPIHENGGACLYGFVKNTPANDFDGVGMVAQGGDGHLQTSVKTDPEAASLIGGEWVDDLSAVVVQAGLRFPRGTIDWSTIPGLMLMVQKKVTCACCETTSGDNGTPGGSPRNQGNGNRSGQSDGQRNTPCIMKCEASWKSRILLGKGFPSTLNWPGIYAHEQKHFVSRKKLVLELWSTYMVENFRGEFPSQSSCQRAIHNTEFLGNGKLQDLLDQVSPWKDNHLNGGPNHNPGYWNSESPEYGRDNYTPLPGSSEIRHPNAQVRR